MGSQTDDNLRNAIKVLGGWGGAAIFFVTGIIVSGMAGTWMIGLPVVIVPYAILVVVAQSIKRDEAQKRRADNPQRLNDP